MNLMEPSRGAWSFKKIATGMTANIIISSQQKNNALFVPTRAVKGSGTARTVLVLEGRVEKEVPVTIGIRTNDGQTEIVSGVSAGQIVIVSKEGTK